MNIRSLREPELEFGAGTHVDIRFGLFNYGPFDFRDPVAPRRVALGIVGTTETVDGTRQWLERCRSPIEAKASRQPHLFPPFPGCAPDVGLRTQMTIDDRHLCTIPTRAFDALRRLGDVNAIVAEAVALFLAEIEHVTEQSPPHVVVCALPLVLLEIIQARLGATAQVDKDEGGGSSDGEGSALARLNFRDLLKARAMHVRAPIQLILPATYDKTKRLKQQRLSERPRTLQDEATRAWNFHTALYYKAGGTPWRILRDAAAYTTCFVGISFYRSVDMTRLDTSVAQVFDVRGNGIAVRGAQAHIDKVDRKPHLEAKDAEQLLDNALKRYRAEHRTSPARIVLHKSSRFNAAERAGFFAAADRHGIELVDLLTLGNSSTRLLREGEYPPLRGTLLSLDAATHVLYTRGSVPFFATYPGMYVPVPLLIRCEQAEQTPTFLANEILALTKMNWNSTQFDGDEPITLAAARRVGDVLRYVGESQPIQARYGFYM